MKLDTGNVDTSDAKYVVMTGGQANITAYYNREAFDPSIRATTYEALLYESYWTIDGEESNPVNDEYRSPTAEEFLGKLL